MAAGRGHARLVRRGAVLGAAVWLALAGCKDKPKAQPAQPVAPAGSGSEGGSGAAAGSAGSGAGSGSAVQSEIDIPKATGTPPVKTTKPLEKAQYEKMSAREAGGWKKTIRHISDKAVEVRYKTSARPVLAVTITASPCFDCVPMELPKWKAKADALKNLLPPELRDRKDTTFEIGEVKLAGAPLIYTYQLAHLFGPDETGQQQGAFSNAYALYHNDGVNMIRVVAQYMDDATATRDDLANLAPREDLARIAIAFLDAYTHDW
jgi:hypothetical protein